MAIIESGAHLGDRPSRSFGGNPDVDDERVERVLPEVVGVPPIDLAEQIGLHPGSDQRRRLERVVTLVVLVPPTELRLGEVPRADVLVVDGVAPGGPRLLDGIGGEPKEHLTREGVVPGVQLPQSEDQPAKIPAVGRLSE